MLRHFDPDRQSDWPVADDDEPASVRVSGPVRADSALALLAAVLGGAGIGLLAGFLVSRPLAEGRLVELLPDATTRPYAVFAVRPPTAYLSRAVEAVTDGLRSWLLGPEA